MTVEAKDLRLGMSALYYYDAIISVGLNDIENIYSNPSQNPYRPIPLSEKWLTKLGFHKIINRGANLDTSTIEEVYYLYKSGIWEVKVRFIEGKILIHIWDVKSLNGNRWNISQEKYYTHIFQNLIFALTGNELEMK